MVEFLIKLLLVVRTKLKLCATLEAAYIVLSQQVIVLRRKALSPGRFRNRIVPTPKNETPVARCWPDSARDG